MIQIYLSNIHCYKETNEVGADEPYVLVTVVNLASTVSVGSASVPLPAFEVVRYGPFDDVDKGETHFAPGASQSFWSVNGSPAVLADPDKVIFLVSLMENDDGDPEALRGIVKGIVGGSVLGSLSLNRNDKVTALIRDVNSALGTPTGAPNFDDKVGGPQELRFSREELARAERGELVRTTLFTRGDGGHYTMTFEVRNPEMWRRWFQIHPETVFDHTTQQIAAVSRAPGNLDLFVIGFDNAVWSTFWNDTVGWNPNGWFRIHPETVFDHTTQQIAAVSRAPGNLDLFVIGFDNAVWSTFWNDAVGWNPNGWFRIHPETVFDHTTQQIAAVSRAPGNLDLFVIGFDNAVWSTFWNDTVGWNPNGWFQIHPETVFDHTTQQIAAVSRAPGNLDLFVIGFDNAIWSTFWSDSGGWNPNGWFQIHPETVFDHTAQQVAAVSRAPGNLDLFVIGFDNAIWTTFWNDTVGWNPGGWFQIHPETVFDHTTQQVAAVSRAPGNLDLFVIGFDNAVWSAWWSPA